MSGVTLCGTPWINHAPLSWVQSRDWRARAGVISELEEFEIFESLLAVMFPSVMTLKRKRTCDPTRVFQSRGVWVKMLPVRVCVRVCVRACVSALQQPNKWFLLWVWKCRVSLCVCVVTDVHPVAAGKPLHFLHVLSDSDGQQVVLLIIQYLLILLLSPRICLAVRSQITPLTRRWLHQKNKFDVEKMWKTRLIFFPRVL